MRIAILVEGNTEEKVFLPALKRYVEKHLAGRMPVLSSRNYRGRIPKGQDLREDVEYLLNDRVNPADAVIALTDVYTGTHPPEFEDAEDAKKKMRSWVGDESRFYPHAAQYEIEAWLLPFWNRLQQLSGGNLAPPGANPELVNHDRPPSERIKELFRQGKKADYVKQRTAATILRDADLDVTIKMCGELKALINTILSLCGGDLLP
jgi:hypothetical protein